VFWYKDAVNINRGCGVVKFNYLTLKTYGGGRAAPDSFYSVDTPGEQILFNDLQICVDLKLTEDCFLITFMLPSINPVSGVKTYT